MCIRDSLVAALLASWLTHVLLEPIVSLDLHAPLKNDAYDELSPLLHRMDKQNHKIDSQMNELKRRQAEFDDITARMDEGLILFSAQGDILFANRAVCALFPKDSASGGYMTLCRDPEYIRVVEAALDVYKRQLQSVLSGRHHNHAHSRFHKSK